MGRYWWSSSPERHLEDWRRERDYRTVDFAEVFHTRPDATVDHVWTCAVGDLEPCRVRGGFVRVVIHGTGPTRAAAADKCLTTLAERALARAKKEQAHAPAPAPDPAA